MRYSIFAFSSILFNYTAATQIFETPTNQCVAAGEKCPDFGGSFWECCTWACDETNSVCRTCAFANEKCEQDSDCCLGFCQEDGTCAECLPAGKPCGLI